MKLQTRDSESKCREETPYEYDKYENYKTPKSDY